MQAVSRDRDRLISRGVDGRRSIELVALLVGVVFLFPLGYLVWGTASLGGDVWEQVTSRATLVPLRNSLLIATTTSAMCGLVGTALAWLTTRTALPGRRVWATVLPLPLVIPSFVGATALLAAFGRGGLVPAIPRLQGFWGAFIVLTLLSYPYVYLPVAARLATTVPDLEEAALILDGNSWRTFRRVIYPQIRASLAGGVLLVFLYVLSDFGAVTLLRYDAITRAIFSARLADRAASLTLGLVLALLALVVAASDRAFARPPSGVPATHATQVRYGLGRGRWPAFALVAAVVSAGFAAPLAVFVTWVLRGSTTVGVGYSGLGDDLGFLAGPLVNSAWIAVVAAVAAVIVVLPVAYVSARKRHPIASWSAAFVASVFALPGLVVALALVFWAVQAPQALAGLYQTFPLLVLAYVLHFGAQSMAATRAAVEDLPVELEEVARTLGARPLRRFVTIEAPLIAPGLIAGGGLVLLSVLKELPATLLLAPIGFQTLATKIWGAAEDGFFAEVGITSLVLVGLSWVLTWLFVLRRRN